MSNELLEAILQEQRKTNELLLTLIEALGDEVGDDPGEVPARFMDGILVDFGE